MLLPGTFLGVWNLIGISRLHTLESLSPAWLQAHGQAQLFGWIGSFILGIGFYSLTKMQSTLVFPARWRYQLRCRIHIVDRPRRISVSHRGAFNVSALEDSKC
jgi:hypothetical protein